MYWRASKDMDEPVNARTLIYKSDFLTMFYCVRHCSMGCVLLYLSMFSCFKPNRILEIKEENVSI